jgi:hypothetical protein
MIVSTNNYELIKAGFAEVIDRLLAERDNARRERDEARNATHSATRASFKVDCYRVAVHELRRRMAHVYRGDEIVELFEMCERDGVQITTDGRLCIVAREPINALADIAKGGR